MSRRINVLFVNYNLDRGGAEEITLTYAKGLNKELFNVTVACFVGGTVSNEIAALRDVRLLHITSKSRIIRFLTMWKLARTTNTDIVHNVGCWYGLIVGFLVRARRVEMLQSMYLWLNWHERLRYGFYLLLANRIIAVSTAVKEFTIDFFPFVHERKFDIIYNSVDPTRFLGESDVASLRTELGLREDQVVIGFVGRFSEQKGVSYLLEAAEAMSTTHPSAVFVLVGDGELRADMENRSRSIGLNNVIFAGFQRDIPKFLHMFDIFVLPSLWEGLPVAVLEAMAANLPVVATRVSGTPEAVLDGITGYLVAPRNVLELRARLSSLVEHPADRLRMGRAGRERVCTIFSSDTMIDATVQLYHKLLHAA